MTLIKVQRDISTRTKGLSAPELHYSSTNPLHTQTLATRVAEIQKNGMLTSFPHAHVLFSGKSSTNSLQLLHLGTHLSGLSSGACSLPSIALNPFSLPPSLLDLKPCLASLCAALAWYQSRLDL